MEREAGLIWRADVYNHGHLPVACIGFLLRQVCPRDLKANDPRRRTHVAQFIEVAKEVLRLGKHEVSFYLDLLQGFHKALFHKIHMFTNKRTK